MTNIIMLGLPGAGKGTQATMIAELLSIPHISTGDLFRQEYNERSALGILAKNYMNKGELVPDEITIGVGLNRLKKPDCEKGFLLDGFPRNGIQADALEQFLLAQSHPVDHAIYIHVDESILLERLTGRRVCSGCGTSYHIIYNPSKVTNSCDLCQQPLIQREDDKEETILERFRVNKDLTNELIEYYKKKGVLRTVDGSAEISKIKEEIGNLMGNN